MILLSEILDANTAVTAGGTGGIVLVLWSMVRAVSKVSDVMLRHLTDERRHWRTVERALARIGASKTGPRKLVLLTDADDTPPEGAS